MEDFKKQFKKGVIELAILKLLNENDQYGYAIIQEISKKSKQLLEVKDGTLYPILYRLEDNKSIESYWYTEEDSSGKARKYYKITEIGKRRYTEMLTDYLEINEGIKKVLKS